MVGRFEPRHSVRPRPALLASDQWQSRNRTAGRPPSGAWGNTARVSFGDVQVAPAEVQTVTVAVVNHLFLNSLFPAICYRLLFLVVSPLKRQLKSCSSILEKKY